MKKELLQHLKKGEYDRVTSGKELSRVLNAQLQALSHDKHLQMLVMDAPPEGKPAPEPTAEELRQWRARRNFGLQKLEVLEGNVGYLALESFMSTEQMAPTLASAMGFLANTDALIIDLRKNFGGKPDTVALVVSYLLDGNESVHINSIRFREGNRLREWWSQPSLPGPRYVGKPVYVLTSHDTPSAGEELAYDLQALERATLVGEVTWGGANPSSGVELTPNFLISVPIGQAINPVTGTNWEGKGVVPDVSVPAADALRVAHVAALKRLEETAKDPDLQESLTQARRTVEARR
jgi:C-terminal processing protease CtpA/Prc